MLPLRSVLAVTLCAQHSSHNPGQTARLTISYYAPRVVHNEHAKWCTTQVSGAQHSPVALR